ncbi:type IV secretion system DNA-binding domain-containing protein [Patescibacteria group bacterium]|nr:type IV secretion system DNA-binding domain-containing protein [Patescibacteria group bacterium]MBU4512554.1 type IV secretion system DNA-binding domain-containing protein [Patescibacteria group bacterium]MCG2693060.1 type IV secretion system DNA-binding domain-containing protein [Candidatus Parcubacteria bacterium]
MTILLISAIGIIILGVLAYIARFFLRRANKYQSVHNFVTLLITVPKEEISQEEESRQGYIQSLIAPAENLFANLGGMKAQKGLRAFFLGRIDHFSCEIVADKEGLISFYMAVPRKMQEFVEQQVQAQYHDAQIEERPDYNIFNPKGVVVAANLVQKKDYIFPLKTYTSAETDSLNAITNTLSKFDPKEGAVIQIIARSSHPRWHARSSRVAREMQKGKTIQQAMRTISGGSKVGKVFSFFGGFVSASTGKTKEEKEKEMLGQNPRQLSPMEAEMVKGIEEKTSKAGLDVNIRLVVSAETEDKAQSYLRNMIDSFSQYAGYEYGNGFKAIDEGTHANVIGDFIYRHFNPRRSFVLNTAELASIFHLPLPTTETPNIRWLLAKKLPPPVNIPKEGLLLGENIYRGKKVDIHIARKDRQRHMYIIGMTGVGKSVLLSNMAIQDIQNGEGVCVVDPHGTLVEDILKHIPKERAEDVVIFNPSDIERPVGLNMLEAKTPGEGDFAIQEMIAIFYKLFPPEMIGPMFEHNMRNVMLTLMSDPESPGTIAEIPRMFSDTDFQKTWVAKVKDPVVRAFWEKEMAKTSDFHKSEMLGYLISKVGRFVENAMMRNIIGQTHSGFDFREMMDQGKILLVNLCKGTTGEVNSNLLGLIVVSKLQMAALARADLPEEERKDFYLYIDEFQNFVTDSIATILAEARKYKLNLIMAHQYIGQLIKNQDTKTRDAIFGNVGTVASFRVGVDDAETIAKQLGPPVTEYDVMNMERYNAYTRLLVDNQASKPFNMATLAPVPGDPKLAEHIKELSRLRCGRERKIVEEEILERTKLGSSETQGKTEAAEKSL